MRGLVRTVVVGCTEVGVLVPRLVVVVRPVMGVAIVRTVVAVRVGVVVPVYVLVSGLPRGADAVVQQRAADRHDEQAGGHAEPRVELLRQEVLLEQ